MSWSVLYNMRVRRHSFIFSPTYLLSLKKLLGPSSTQRLDSLSGMRVISMGWVILAHTLSFLLFTNLPENIFYLLQSFQDDWEWQIVLSGFFAVGKKKKPIFIWIHFVYLFNYLRHVLFHCWIFGVLPSCERACLKGSRQLVPLLHPPHMVSPSPSFLPPLLRRSVLRKPPNK